MLVTEAEATKRWCPFARVLDGDPPGGAGVNRSGPAAGYDCIGSACMAWRTVQPEYEESVVSVVSNDVLAPEDDKPDGEGWELRTRYSEGGGYAYSVWRRAKERRGYCGLAGEP